MRITPLLAITVILASIPYMLGRWLSGEAGPRQLIGVSVLTLFGLASSVILLLATVAGPTDLPVRVIPDAVERCVDATGQLLSHPLGHWPHIIVSTLLMAALFRVLIAALQTMRDTRQWGAGGSRRASIVHAADHQPWSDITVIQDDAALACTTGVLHPRIVVSTGLLNLLSAEACEVVVAHERAHVRGWHPVLLFFGRVVSRAFGFLPPVRRAVDHLLLGLEFAADESAARTVGDPLTVARALAALADGAYGDACSPAVLGADGSDLVGRVRRLLRGSPPTAKRRATALVVVACIVLLLSAQIVVFAMASPSPDSARSRELHSVCHLPHAAVPAR